MCNMFWSVYDLIYLINDQFAHHMDSVIHKCKVRKRETRRGRITPRLNGFTDDQIFEVREYYGAKDAMRIMERGREPEWESNREDPYFCVCGKHHMLDVGSLYARSVGSASSYM